MAEDFTCKYCLTPNVPPGAQMIGLDNSKRTVTYSLTPAQAIEMTNNNSSSSRGILKFAGGYNPETDGKENICGSKLSPAAKITVTVPMETGLFTSPYVMKIEYPKRREYDNGVKTSQETHYCSQTGGIPSFLFGQYPDSEHRVVVKKSTTLTPTEKLESTAIFAGDLYDGAEKVIVTPNNSESNAGKSKSGTETVYNRCRLSTCNASSNENFFKEIESRIPHFDDKGNLIHSDNYDLSDIEL